MIILQPYAAAQILQAAADALLGVRAAAIGVGVLPPALPVVLEPSATQALASYCAYVRLCMPYALVVFFLLLVGRIHGSLCRGQLLQAAGHPGGCRQAAVELPVHPDRLELLTSEWSQSYRGGGPEEPSHSLLVTMFAWHPLL